MRITEVTDFDWDNIYVFGCGAGADLIEEEVGPHIPEKTRFTRKLVFTKGGVVVRYDELPANIEGIVDNQVDRDNASSYLCKFCPAEDAVFDVRKFSQGA